MVPVVVPAVLGFMPRMAGPGRVVLTGCAAGSDAGRDS